MIQWAWEFLRRNEEYRNFWLTKAEPLIPAGGTMFWPHYREMREKFGIEDPWSPRQNSRIPAFSDLGTKYAEAPAFRYERLPDSAGQAKIVHMPAGPFSFVQASRENLTKETILENSRLQLSWFEMGFAIDLRFPLEDQLKEIRKMAEEDQFALKKAGLVSPKTAKTSDKYRLYLRILDAEDAGAKPYVIADELFPDIENDYSAGRPRSKAFDNARAEAQRVRESGYRALAYRAKAKILDTLSP